MAKQAELPLYKPNGAAKTLFLIEVPAGERAEVLLEGPAGTGKTVAVLEYVNFMCQTYEGIRVLLTRQTRASMTESVLASFENLVIGNDAECITGDASRKLRDSYTYPNGSHIVVGSLENPDRVMSAEYDIVVVHEATELTNPEAWEKLLTRLRNKSPMPFKVAIAECNPGPQNHWLNRRFPMGSYPQEGGYKRTEVVIGKKSGYRTQYRLKSKHIDNPSVDESYLAILEGLTGARRSRLYLGEWVSEEGVIIDSFSSDRHIIMPGAVPKCSWHFGSVDWGYRDAGVMQVWGVHDDAIYRVAEIYRTGQQIDWWAERAVEMNDLYKLRNIVCDPSEPGFIDKFNQRISPSVGRDMGSIAIKADNDWRPGIDQLIWAFATNRCFLVRDAFPYGIEQEIKSSGKPWCTEEELLSYIWEKGVDGRPVQEKPNRACKDHGIDAARYAAMYAWQRCNLVRSNPLNSDEVRKLKGTKFMQILGAEACARYLFPAKDEKTCGPARYSRGKIVP